MAYFVRLSFHKLQTLFHTSHNDGLKRLEGTSIEETTHTKSEKDKHINNHNYKHVTKHLGNINPSLTLIMTKFNTKLKIKNLQTSLQTTLVLNEFSENLKRSCAYWNFKSILVCNKNLQQEQDFTKNLKRAQRG